MSLFLDNGVKWSHYAGQQLKTTKWARSKR